MYNFISDLIKFYLIFSTVFSDFPFLRQKFYWLTGIFLTPLQLLLINHITFALLAILTEKFSIAFSASSRAMLEHSTPNSDIRRYANPISVFFSRIFSFLLRRISMETSSFLANPCVYDSWKKKYCKKELILRMRKWVTEKMMQ